jgi:glycosyltransferase involved in cell wall biosynthesis
MSLPLISAKCITYGRVNTLEEALHSFLQQDYPGKKELIIVNDGKYTCKIIPDRTETG